MQWNASGLPMVACWLQTSFHDNRFDYQLLEKIKSNSGSLPNQFHRKDYRLVSVPVDVNARGLRLLA